MNRPDFCLKRLMEAAAAAPREVPVEAPFGLEARLLSQWHAVPQNDDAMVLLPVFRGAFLCACVIILVSAALSVASMNETPANEMVIVDSAIQLTLMQ